MEAGTGCRGKSVKAGSGRTHSNFTGIRQSGNYFHFASHRAAAGPEKEAIGACYSINRDSNLGLTTDIYGPDAKETEGTFAVYIVGSVIGTVFISLLAGVVASWNIFHPLAMGMASGVGSGSMLSSAAETLGKSIPHMQKISW